MGGAKEATSSLESLPGESVCLLFIPVVQFHYQSTFNLSQEGNHRGVREASEKGNVGSWVWVMSCEG